jgi:signal transduction histidine kinase
VLDIYRSDNAKVVRPLVAGDISDLLERCAAVARIEAPHREIALDVQIERPLRAEHDAQRLERAISNLLGNALKFSRPGGRVTLNARLTGPDSPPHIHIEVGDNGEGIAEADLPRIFDLYQQAETRQRLAGVGLGLAIVKRIVDAHRGSVSVHSQLGVGTTFAIDLPSI